MNSEQKNLQVEQLDFNTSHPRLPKTIRDAGYQKLVEFMILESTALDLMLAIGMSGFSAGENLLVVNKRGGRYKVVDGNRRLTAVKLLRDPDLATVQQSKVNRIYEESLFKGDQFATLPCTIVAEEELIHRNLGYLHITGIQPWNLRQRAEYLATMRDGYFKEGELDEACRHLAMAIGSRADYVKRMVVSFSIYTVIKENSFFSVKNLDEDSFLINHVLNSLSRPAICEFLGVEMASNHPLSSLKKEHLKLWSEWFFEKAEENQTRVNGSCDHLDKLNTILSDPIAKQSFTESKVSLKDSFERSYGLANFFHDSVQKAILVLEAADRVVHKVDSFPAETSKEMKELQRLVNKLQTSFRIKREK